MSQCLCKTFAGGQGHFARCLPETLEENLHLTKQGPFSSLAFTNDDVNLVADAIIAAGEQKFHWSGSSK